MKKRKGNFALFGLLTILIAGYMFFFSSTVWMPTNLSAQLQTPLNENVQWGDRTLQLIRWDYCEAEQIMEVEINIENNSYDGKNHYRYSAVDRSNEQLTVDTIIEDSNWIILRINNVKEEFGEVSLRLDMPENTDNTLKLYTNVNAVNRVAELKKRDRRGYQRLSLKRKAEAYEKEIQSLEKKKQLLAEKNERMRDEVIRLQNDLFYQTEEQREEQENKINDINSGINTNLDDIQSYEKQIEEKRERIELIEKQMSQ